MQDLWGQAMGEATRVYNRLSGDTKSRKAYAKTPWTRKSR